MPALYAALVSCAVIGAWIGSGTRTIPHSRRTKCIQQDKFLRNNISEDMLDEMIGDTFPASDPATFY